MWTQKDEKIYGLDWDFDISCGFEFECFICMHKLELFSQMSPRALTLTLSKYIYHRVH